MWKQRKIGDNAFDKVTGWTWVCLGGNDDLGYCWAVYTDRGASYQGVEFESGIIRGHESLVRALKSGYRSVDMRDYFPAIMSATEQ